MGAWVAQHRKLLVSIAGAAVTIAVQAGWTSNPWVSLAILAATAAGVYRAPNTDPAPAPAASSPPDSLGGGGGLSRTGTVRVVTPAEPEPAQEQVATPPPGAAAGTEGGPVTGVRP